MTVRTPFRANMRAAAVDLLTDYAASTTPALKLQIYRGRPASVRPPCAFVDRIAESVAYFGAEIRQRTPRVDIVVLHGLFDSGEAVDQADAFADGFLDWCTDNYHEAGADTLQAAVAIEDEPTFVTDWLVPEKQRTYYASRITLEGFAAD